jgi:hypothetical protein
MGPAEVRQFCVIDDVSKSLLRAAMEQMQMSASQRRFNIDRGGKHGHPSILVN